MKIEIKNRYDSDVLFSFECENNTIKKTLLEGIKQGADFSYADLSCANLEGLYLHGADFSYADLSCANLSCADLSCADLSCANLSGANLSGADFSCADLRGTKF